MRRILALAVVSAMSLSVLPLSAATRARAGVQAQAATGAVQGTATSSTGQTLANSTVRLRSLETGQIVGATTSDAAGHFSFLAINPGNYAVEIVNQAGVVVGTSASTTVVAGATVTVSPSAAAAGGAGAAAGASAGGVSTAVVVTTAAVAAGVAAAIAVAVNASGSK